MSAVRAAVVALLTQWRALVRELKDGASVPLPFDFSDEYTGVFVVTRRDESLDVVPGLTLLEGWKHTPSDVAGFLKMAPAMITSDDARLERYTRGICKVSVERGAFLRGIDESVAALEGS